MNPSLLHDLFICIKKSAQATELTRENLVKSLLITNSKNESGAYTLLTCNNSGVIQTVFSFIDEDTKMSVPARMHCITALMQMSDLLDTLYSAASRSHPLLSTLHSRDQIFVYHGYNCLKQTQFYPHALERPLQRP